MNHYFSVPPFNPTGTPTILSFTSEQGFFPAFFALNDRWPFQPWKTTATTQQDLVLNYGSAVPLSALLVTHTNYTGIRLHSSTDNATYVLAGPNILARSHDQTNTGTWVGASISRAVQGAGSGPNPNGQPAVRLIYTGATTLSQTVAFGGAVSGRAFTMLTWLRTTASTPQAATLRIDGGSVNDRSITIQPFWQLFAHSATGSSGTNIVAAISGTSLDILCGGVALATSATTPLALYQTDTNGNLVVPQDDNTGRYGMFVDLRGFNYQYLRYRIPSQSTTDGQSGFSTGSLTTAEPLELLHGKHQFPLSVETPTPAEEVVFESAGHEVLTLGEPRVIVTIQGSYVSSRSEGLFKRINRLQPGSKLIYVENVRYPDAPSEEVNYAHAYLVTLRSARRHAYPMPELFDRETTLEQVI